MLKDSPPALAELPVEEIWGIGHRLTHRLQLHGILTALQLRDVELPWIQQLMSLLSRLHH